MDRPASTPNLRPLGIWDISDLGNYASLHSDLNAAATMEKPDRPGSLSVHNYRRCLYQDDDDFVSDGHGGKKLKRKNGASNLNQTPSISTTSSPPPLSPSYSMSVVSQRSEQEHDGLGGFLFSRTSSPQYSESAIPGRISTRLNTFRDRLRKPFITREPSFHGHNKTRSDSLLLGVKQPKATMVHQGTPFEILNPHESLNFARIVSYIEDVDYSPRPSSDYRRESFISTSSVYTVVKPENDVPARDEMSDRKVDHCEADENELVHSHLVGDVPHVQMPSISELLSNEGSHGEEHEHGHERWTPTHGLRPETGLSHYSDLGEPGPCEEDGVSLSAPSRDLYSHSAWSFRGDSPSQPGHEQEQYHTRPVYYQDVQTQQTQRRGRSLNRLRRIVRSIPFLRRKDMDQRMNE